MNMQAQIQDQIQALIDSLPALPSEWPLHQSALRGRRGGPCGPDFTVTSVDCNY